MAHLLQDVWLKPATRLQHQYKWPAGGRASQERPKPSARKAAPPKGGDSLLSGILKTGGLRWRPSGFPDVRASFQPDGSLFRGWRYRLKQRHFEKPSKISLEFSNMIAFKVILIFTGIVVMICLVLAVICLLAMSRENQLPDIDDI